MSIIVLRRSLLLGSAAFALAPTTMFAASDLGKPAPAFSAADSNGKGGIDSIASSNVNDIPKARQYVRVALDEVLAGKPVTDASTRPYGCTLKYGKNA